LFAAVCLLGLTWSCSPVAPPDVICSGTTLFGRPNAQTGLTDEQCKPSCTCGGEAWNQPTYGEAEVAALKDWQLPNPPAELTSDPYEAAEPPVEAPEAVCGVTRVASGTKDYAVTAYASEKAARAAGATPTHFGACGLCSSLQDLTVYMTQNDLTAPVRQCGLDHFSGPKEDHMQCLLKLGFTRPCASIWYYNTRFTRRACLDECLAAIKEPYNLPDGTLNPCLACDEEKSGPVFKAVAGRTRRNTGLANSICRPCSEVRPLEHRYE